MTNNTQRTNPLAHREPAATLVAPSAPQRPTRSRAKRRWDAENPVTSYRLPEEIPQQIRAAQAYYKHAGYTVSLDQIAADLLAYALDAWDHGQVDIHVTPAHPAAQPISRNGGSS